MAGKLYSFLHATALCVVATGAFANSDVEAGLKAVVDEAIAGWASDPAIVGAVRAQNEVTASYSDERILELDKAWRDQTISGGPLIDTTLGNPVSAHLARIKEAGMGQYTEIFVMDTRGLNVGQSDVTSDYWQGDEAKWQVPATTGAPHFSDVEFDESTQTYQSQVSVPILDGGVVIGVITVGVDVQHVASN